MFLYKMLSRNTLIGLESILQLTESSHGNGTLFDFDYLISTCSYMEKHTYSRKMEAISEGIQRITHKLVDWELLRSLWFCSWV